MHSIFSYSMQDQLQAVTEFKQVVEKYKPNLLDLDRVSSRCCFPPPTPGGPKISTKPTKSMTKVTTDLQEVWECYNALGEVVATRGTVLEGFLPTVQQFESSRGAWGQNLEKWEEQVSNLPQPATKPVILEEQIKAIKVCNLSSTFIRTYMYALIH